MGIGLALIDQDEIFAGLDHTPFIANDFNTLDPKGKEDLDNIFLTYYNSDSIQIDARCECGNVRGSFNEGILCPICGTRAESTVNNEVKASLWIRAPEGIRGLILPHVWVLLNNTLSDKEFNLFRWLIDRRYRAKSHDTEQKVVAAFDNKRGIHLYEKYHKRRGLNNFIDNFDEIITDIGNSYFASGKKSGIEEFVQFCRRYKRFFFPKHLPIPSKLCFIVERTTTGTYVDPQLAPGLDAVRTIATTSRDATRGKHAITEYRTVKALESLGAFYRTYVDELLSKKPGVWRKHVFGARMHFTGRAVITSISKPHHYQDLEIPYGLAVQVLKYDIANKLLKRGMTPNEILETIQSSVNQVNPLIQGIIEELVASTPNGRGIPCTLTRNPSLRRGSTQFMYAKVKFNVADKTIGMPATVLMEPNADRLGLGITERVLPQSNLWSELCELLGHP